MHEQEEEENKKLIEEYEYINGGEDDDEDNEEKVQNQLDFQPIESSLLEQHEQKVLEEQAPSRSRIQQK